MYNIIDHADHDASVKEYIVDTVAELENLPGAMGSSAFCLEDKSIYIKDGSGSWRKI